MKVLLVLPRTKPNTNPPLGLAYIAAILRKNGVGVEILDPTFEGAEYALKRLCQIDYDLLGIGTYTMNFNLGLEWAKFVKARKKDIPILFGGVHPTILFQEVIENKEIDFVVIGEGEETTLELWRALKGIHPLEAVKGLVFKRNGEVMINPPRPLMEPLDSILFPA